jgi:hypothetical protein
MINKGYYVDKVENCSLVNQSAKEVRHRQIKKINGIYSENNDSNYKVGGNFMIPFGPLKGYSGVIIKASKDGIEVRVAHKNWNQKFTKEEL